MKGRRWASLAAVGCGALVLVAGCFLRPNRSPVAVFTATPPQGSTPLSVEFDATRSYDPDGAVLEYRWAFGDGASDSGPTPTHVYLKPGTYTVQLTVEDRRQAQGTVSSPIVARAGGNNAIVVGIADYARMTSLGFADQDGVSVAARLASLPGWKEADVELLLNGQATAANLTKSLDALRGGSEDDLLFFFFSGHGNRVRDVSGDEADGYDEVLSLYDADLLDDTLAEWLAAAPAGRIVVMIDACYSGGELHSLSANEREAVTPDGWLEDLARARGPRPLDLDRSAKSLVAVAASRFNQLSWELTSLRHGIFAYALLEALDGQADASGDQDGMTSAEECFSYTGPRVSSLARGSGVVQTPQMLDLCPGELEFAGAPQI